jgi:hypothetical protein
MNKVATVASMTIGCEECCVLENHNGFAQSDFHKAGDNEG